MQNREKYYKDQKDIGVDKNKDTFVNIYNIDSFDCSYFSYLVYKIILNFL